MVGVAPGTPGPGALREVRGGASDQPGNPAARSLPVSSQSCWSREAFSVPKLEPRVLPSDSGPGCGERRDPGGRTCPRKKLVMGEWWYRLCKGLGTPGRGLHLRPLLSLRTHFSPPWASVGIRCITFPLCGRTKHRCAVVLPLTSFLVFFFKAYFLLDQW